MALLPQNRVAKFTTPRLASKASALFQSEIQPLIEISWDELNQKVASIASALRSMGVQRGDRVAAYMPNIHQTIMAFLACASIGATWSNCSPDFGTRSVVDRFKQIKPKVLFAVDGYQYGGKGFDCRPAIVELQQSLLTLEQTVLVPYLDPAAGFEKLENKLIFDDLLKRGDELIFEKVPRELF